MDVMREQRERDLATYYDNEVHERAGRELSDDRVARRAAYIELLRAEGRRTVLEVGAGPGRDGTAFTRAGLDYTGFRSDERVRATLGRHGTVERWETWPGASDLHYQFAVVRTPA